MKNETIRVKELAEELALTVSVINIHIGEGRAGEVTKIGEGKTKDYALTVQNILTLLNWLRVYGRGNKLKLLIALDKYEKLNSE